MKQSLVIIFCLFLSTCAMAQTEEALVERTGMNYIEGFYEGDEDKLKACLQPTLNKFGFWKDENSGEFGEPIKMSYEGALDYARGVKEKQNFPDPSAPKSVEILDLEEHIAVAKVTAWWGVDYLLMSKQSGTWKIEQVIWEGPNK